MNDGKVGRPFKITYRYIVFMAVVRYLFSMPYRQLYGRKKHYIKIHFAIDARTKEIIAIDVTTDDVHDSEVLPSLMANA
jgi:hypothetical protein